MQIGQPYFSNQRAGVFEHRVILRWEASDDVGAKHHIGAHGAHTFTKIDDVATQMAAYHRSLVGKTLEVVVEQDGKTGHAEGFALVRLPREMPVGSLQRVSIARADGEAVYAA